MQLAYDNTFVIEDKIGNIKHVSSEGKKLSEIKIKNIHKFMMLAEDKVIILSVNAKDNFYVLTLWNLIQKNNVSY